MGYSSHDLIDFLPSDPSLRASWILVGYTTAASVLGSLIIFSDLVWNRLSGHKFSILHSRAFLGTALSISSGTLLITALNSLLTSAVSYIVDAGHPLQVANKWTLVAFVMGINVCVVLNAIVHAVTRRSVVSCAHSFTAPFKPDETSPLLHEHACPDPEHVHNEVVAHPNHPDRSDITIESHDPGHSHSHGHAGPSEIYIDHSETHSHFGHSHDDIESHPHSDAESDCSSIDHLRESTHNTAQLLSIGLQTALGIAVHRVPEGFLLFATSRADRQLGVSLVLSLAIHSFSEGFSIAVPLYGALGSRGAASMLAILLGGGSQPLGALLAQWYMPEEGLQPSQFAMFGVAIAGTAGFMVTIAFQMIGTAVVYQRSQKSATYLALCGILLVLFARCLQ